MQRSLRLSLSLSGVAALALAGTPLLPAAAQENGSADDLGVMSISLKDVVKTTFGFQSALQGAGTPNQAGIGGFLPISVGENSVFFADVHSMPTLLITAMTAASSIQKSLVPPSSAPHQDLVIAG